MSLAFPLDNSYYQNIRNNKLFNFDEIFFEGDLPARVESSGEVLLIADKKYAKADASIHDLEQQNWNILKFDIDGKTYPSFIMLRKEGKTSGNLLQSIIDFALSKVTKKESLSDAGVKAVKSALTGFAALGAQNTFSEKDMASIIEPLIASTANFLSKEDKTKIIEDFFTRNNIPIGLDENSYLFQITMGEESWNVELFTGEKTERVVLCSSVYLVGSLKKDILLEELNELNLTMEVGSFEFNVHKQILYFRNSIYLNALSARVMLETLFDDNFKVMQAILPVLREKNYPVFLNGDAEIENK